MKSKLDAEMLKIKAGLTPETKVAVTDFIKAVNKEFDKLTVMAALYIDMAGFMELAGDLNPEHICDCEASHYCPDDNVTYPAHLCKHHQQLENLQENAALYGNLFGDDFDDELPF